ncbi:HTH-type transcriptional activator RhaS [Salmonella enterica subsp. enterica serovar Choleraesuis]|nr:HTH-type transcriptional activator RhaS [Salmonella enterica subsp. enterica serovar Choleraesuis]
MTKLHSVDYFPSGRAKVTIEQRQPQAAFPEHHHDFFEIVIVEHGTGSHIFNGQPYTLSGGSVCFIRDHDRHLYEHTEDLCLTNVLYRAPDAFNFLSGLERLLPQERDGHYPAHWRVGSNTLAQVRLLVDRLAAAGEGGSDEDVAQREMLFLQLILLLRQGSLEEPGTGQGSLNHLLSWLEDNFGQDVEWEGLAGRFNLSLRTLHRQLKQRTGLTPQRYLNRLRLCRARYMLRHSEERITDIAYSCGFSDSNHFSTLFRREFQCSPRDLRHGRELPTR